MFKLVGEDTFHIDQTRCIIRVDPAPGFKYEYSLYIDGKSHEQYTEDITRQYRLWLYTCDSEAEARQEYRIMLKLDTLSLYVNDELRTEEVGDGNGFESGCHFRHTSLTRFITPPFRSRFSFTAAQTPNSCCRTRNSCFRHAQVAINMMASFTLCWPMGCQFRRQRFRRLCKSRSPFCRATEAPASPLE
ncbi:uncharacterized protein LOC108144183 isoform X3 [Drosophila elegans]|nr:uncharacterized protein LOC108144183 isoform X3 [Drosophila elegans]